MSKIALVRRPVNSLADGIVTHIDRVPLDVDLAIAQHAAYCAALAAAGWQVQEVEQAPDHPDSVFIEDTVVVVGDLAIMTRPGAASRQGEVAGTAAKIAELGLETVTIQAPGTLEGGDVLQVGDHVYVGRGGRTNADGIRQLAAAVAPLGKTVIPVRLKDVLHLKSAVTALPDGTFLALPELLEPGAIASWRPVTEEGGAHVVPLGGTDILIAASAPETATWLADLGFTPHVVDISEFEKLEGCVTCLSVLIP